MRNLWLSSFATAIKCQISWIRNWIPKARMANSKINRRKSRAQSLRRILLRYNIYRMYNLLSQEARRLLDVRVLCRPRVFNEKFPKRFLYKRRGRSAEGAANRDHFGRIIADPAATLFTLQYSLSHWILIRFPTKITIYSLPLRTGTHTSHIVVLFVLRQTAREFRIIIVSKFASVFTDDSDASSSSLLSMSLTSAV